MEPVEVPLCVPTSPKTPLTWRRLGHEVKGEHVWDFHGEELQHHARQVTPARRRHRWFRRVPDPPASKAEPPTKEWQLEATQAAQRDLGTDGRWRAPLATFGSLAPSSSQTSQTHPPCRAGNRCRCPLCRPGPCAARPGSLIPAARPTPPGHFLVGEWPSQTLLIM